MWYVFWEVRVVSEVSKAWVRGRTESVWPGAVSTTRSPTLPVEESGSARATTGSPAPAIHVNARAKTRPIDLDNAISDSLKQRLAQARYLRSFTPRKRSPRGIGALFSVATGKLGDIDVSVSAKFFWVSYFLWIVFPGGETHFKIRILKGGKGWGLLQWVQKKCHHQMKSPVTIIICSALFRRRS